MTTKKFEVKELKEERENKEDPKLIIESKIKSAVPELQVSGDVPDALNKKVISLLEEGSKRAKANGRKSSTARSGKPTRTSTTATTSSRFLPA